VPFSGIKEPVEYSNRCPPGHAAFITVEQRIRTIGHWAPAHSDHHRHGTRYAFRIGRADCLQDIRRLSPMKLRRPRTSAGNRLTSCADAMTEQPTSNKRRKRADDLRACTALTAAGAGAIRITGYGVGNCGSPQPGRLQPGCIPHILIGNMLLDKYLI